MSHVQLKKDFTAITPSNLKRSKSKTWLNENAMYAETIFRDVEETHTSCVY